MKMVHTYRLLILLSTAAARKASWERTLPGSRDSSTKGAALRRKAKFDVLRKKALKNGHEELAAAIDELKRRDAALTEAERENRRPRPSHGKGFGYAHGDEGVDDDDPQLDTPPAVVEVEEDAELRRATVAARTRDDAPRGKPPARSPEYEAELEAWQAQRKSHAAQRQAIDDAYQDLLKRIHEASMDKRPL